jgi:hypothetical protein
MARSRSSNSRSGSRSRTAAPRAGGRSRSSSSTKSSSKSSKSGKSKAPKSKGKKSKTCTLAGSERPRSGKRIASNACEVQVGFDPVEVKIEDGMTVEQAFAQAAEELGLDTESAVTYKARGQLIDGDTLVEAGVLYIANPAKSGKGAKGKQDKNKGSSKGPKAGKGKTPTPKTQPKKTGK